MALLVSVMAQMFTDLTAEDVIAMLNLTPLEETTIGKQIYGRGVSQGLSKGELIGKIQFAQKVLRLPISAKEDLTLKSHEELRAVLQQLEGEVETVLNAMKHS